MKTQTMKGSPFIGPFEAEIGEWEDQLVSDSGCCRLIKIIIYSILRPIQTKPICWSNIVGGNMLAPRLNTMLDDVG